jgi:hypothetical protein
MMRSMTPVTSSVCSILAGRAGCALIMLESSDADAAGASERVPLLGLSRVSPAHPVEVDRAGVPLQLALVIR